MNEDAAHTRRELRKAVNASAFLGWFAVAAPFLFADPFLLPWVAGFGLPIAFAACWLVGAPILRRVMKKPVTWLSAVVWGGVIAFVIAVISIAIGRFQGWRQFKNPNSYSQIGGGDYVRSVDGILTPYGWWYVAQNTALFVLAGMGIALIVRGVIEAGRSIDN